MLSSYILAPFLLLATTKAQDLPPAFFLAGDSTTAPDGGWGDAFVASLTNGAIGTNYAASGRTTTSFRADGYWDEVINAVSTNAGSYSPYVTIQFGHNDQKTDEGLAVFVDNLVAMDQDVRNAGGTSIFLTSLSRRNYKDGQVVQDLANVRNLTIQAATEAGALWADLNDRSREYLNDIGEEDAMTYNLSEDDHTHLNEAGGVVFAGLVGILLDETVSSFVDYIAIDSDLAAALEAGEYYYPS